MDKRLEKIKTWLDVVLNQPLLSIAPASQDASFRRYFRARTENASYVVMDAPPEKESLSEFFAIDRALIDLGVHAPIIHQVNLEDGFLLLEDLGDRTYLNELESNSKSLYSDAIKALVKIQTGIIAEKNPSELTPRIYDAALINKELNLFDDWYLKRHLDIELDAKMELIWQDTKDLLVQAFAQQPQVWVHRDYHSRNLMIQEHNSPAVIDFQDLVIGPVAYDLASLFKDCYIEWPRNQQHFWLAEYLEHLDRELPSLAISIDDLIRWVDFTGLQRHLKVLGIFCRLNYRDGKAHYLDDLPLVKKYVIEVIDIYPEFKNFKTMLNVIYKQVTV
ncbi:MAG: aminoglycoside/choline kinase family phosphotransferase [Arenicella sp.]|jgi:aminoglycoside/choline kinase family phosphotransferase